MDDAQRPMKSAVLPPTIELSDPTHQQISTINTSALYYLLSQRAGQTAVNTAIAETLASLTERTYLGQRIDIDYLRSPHNWIDNKLAERLLPLGDEFGLSPFQLGYETLGGRLACGPMVGLAFTASVGMNYAIKHLNRLNALYNRTKTPALRSHRSDSLVIDIQYEPGIVHTQATTMNNVGAYVALLEHFGYDQVRWNVESDVPGTSDTQGHTRLQFRWEADSLRRRWLRSFQNTILVPLVLKVIKHVRHPSFVALKVHPVDYQKFQNERKVFDKIEQHYRASLAQKESIIEQQERTIDEQTSKLHSLRIRLVDKYEDWIAEHFSDPEATVEKAVKDIGTTYATLNRRLKERDYPTAKKMLNDHRLKQAKMRLSQESASEVAYACGFKTPSHFAQAFKANFGLSPSEYKQGAMRTEIT